jgi:hypothetical protein
MCNHTSTHTWVTDVLFRLDECVDVDVKEHGLGSLWVIALNIVLLGYTPKKLQ